MKAKYKAEYCEALKEHASLGGSNGQFALLIGVHRVTIRDWVKQYPEFKQAYQDAERLRAAYWKADSYEYTKEVQI
jgi:transposase